MRSIFYKLTTTLSIFTAALILAGCSAVQGLPDDVVITAQLVQSAAGQGGTTYVITKDEATRTVVSWPAGTSEKTTYPVSQQDWNALKEGYAELPPSALGVDPSTNPYGCVGSSGRHIKATSSGDTLSSKIVDCGTTKEGEAEFLALQNLVVALLNNVGFEDVVPTPSPS